MNRSLFGVTALLSVLLFSLPPYAPAQRAGGSKPLEIKNLAGNRIKTPVYDVQVQGGGSSRSRADWLEVEVEFDTEPDWMTELTFTYYVLCKAGSRKDVESAGGREFNLFSRTVTHLDTKKGRKHLSAAYLHPHTLERFGEVQAVAVVASYEGSVVAEESSPKTKTRWWENPKYLPVKTGYLLNRWETPFVYHRYEEYGQIKLSK